MVFRGFRGVLCLGAVFYKSYLLHVVFQWNTRVFRECFVCIWPGDMLALLNF